MNSRVGLTDYHVSRLSWRLLRERGATHRVFVALVEGRQAQHWSFEHEEFRAWMPGVVAWSDRKKALTLLNARRRLRRLDRECDGGWCPSERDWGKAPEGCVAPEKTERYIRYGRYRCRVDACVPPGVRRDMFLERMLLESEVVT